MKKKAFLPLPMTIPGVLMLLIIVAICLADIFLPYRESMDFAMAAAPYMMLCLAALIVGFVFTLAKMEAED